MALLLALLLASTESLEATGLITSGNLPATLWTDPGFRITGVALGFSTPKTDSREAAGWPCRCPGGILELPLWFSFADHSPVRGCIGREHLNFTLGASKVMPHHGLADRLSRSS